MDAATAALCNEKESIGLNRKTKTLNYDSVSNGKGVSSHLDSASNGPEIKIFNSSFYFRSFFIEAQSTLLKWFSCVPCWSLNGPEELGFGWKQELIVRLY